VLEAERLAGIAEGEGLIARAVVGHHALNLDAELLVIGKCGLEEEDRTVCGFIEQDEREGDARGIVDTNMNIFPARAFAFGARIALACAIAGDAMTSTLEAAEFLGVEMNKFAGMLALLTPDRLGRHEVLELAQAQAPQDPADRCAADAKLGGDRLAGPAFATQGLGAQGGLLCCRAMQTMRP
jgi:hypothetical protein